MRKYIALIGLLLNAMMGFSQSGEFDLYLKQNQKEQDSLHSKNASVVFDTIYFDEAWKACLKAKASFYRVVTAKSIHYLIQDYYLNGTLQMEGISTTASDPLTLHGICTYYNDNGTVSSKGEYRYGVRTGIWYYYNRRGKFIESKNYDNPKAGVPERIVPLEDKHFSVALRGKVFGFFIIEDTYFSTGTIGAEFLIKGKHSLGIDYTYFGWQYETDDMDDKALYETYERRSYAYLDYRYKFLSYRNLDVYFNLYDKIGTYHKWQEGVTEGYNFSEKPFLTDKVDGTFHQVGVGLGLKCYLAERFYLDVSANGAKLFSNNTSMTYDNSLQVSTTQYNVKENKNNFYIRVNFGCKLFVKRDKRKEVLYDH